MQQKNYKLSAWMYIFCTACWIFCAVMNFMDKSYSVGGLQAVLAVFFFVLAIIHFKRAKEQDKENK